jgi:hypothetical protein
MLTWVVFGGPHEATERGSRERTPISGADAAGVHGRGWERTLSLTLRDREVATSSKRKQAIRRVLSFTPRRLEGRYFALTKEAPTRLSRAIAKGAKYSSSPFTSCRFGPRTGIPARGLRAAPEHESRKATRHACTSRNARKSQKTNDRGPFYPAHFSSSTGDRLRQQASGIIWGGLRWSYGAMLSLTAARQTHDRVHGYEKW